MAWIKVPLEHHPIFVAALPDDPRIETMKMFGGLAAKANGHFFAGLFGRSTMLLLAEPARSRALALDGAGMFDPMGNGRVSKDKVMLPEALMKKPSELARWIRIAFDGAVALPAKAAKSAPKKSASKKASNQSSTKRAPRPEPRAEKKSFELRKKRSV